MMEAEVDRLRRMYGEMGDEHLLDLAGEKEDLTAEAQMALGEELRRRKLGGVGVRNGSGEVSTIEITATHDATPTTQDEPDRAYAFGAGIPGMVPAAGAGVEQALDEGGEERRGMVRLLSFSDGLQLSSACSALEEADLEPAIEEITGDAAVGSTTRYEIWVAAADYETARTVLQDRLGLFPTAETERVAGEEVTAGKAELGSGLVVAQFESAAEAEEARALLTSHGFSAQVEGDESDRGPAAVTVRAEEHERALQVLEERLGVEE